MVHHHKARNLHYDLRLEAEGVLWSWAVPKGPSPDPRVKRLAVRVEDHPLEYADFEGRIPEGNYGAGATIVWDSGTWVPLGDPVAGLEAGKLLFELRGYKLRGRWTLVRTRQGWLLIKERDAEARAGETADYPPDSVRSGHTVWTLAEGIDPGEAVREAAAKAGARRRRIVGHVPPMLASRAREPFSKAGWGFEIKYDGYRMLALRDGTRAVLYSRSGADISAAFPELVGALRALPFEHVVLDGECVVHDERGLPSFARLHARARLRRAADVRRAAAERPATLYVVDALGACGFDFRSLPFRDRKRLLARLLPSTGPLRHAEYIEDDGEAMYEAVRAMGLEGLVAKRLDAPYRSGRSSSWLKIVGVRSGDFVVVGFTLRKDGDGLGSLLLAEHVEGVLTYRGAVGTGFDERTARGLLATLRSLHPGPVPAGGPAGTAYRWTEPVLVAEVRYKEVTPAGQLRQAVFVRLRDDKRPEECVSVPDVEAVLGEEAAADPLPATRGVTPPPSARRSELALTNLEKVFWPEDGYTKGDLVGYYRTIAPWILPYLAGRPLVLTRFPDGIHGKSFFQHDAPAYAAGHVRLERMWSGDRAKEISSFIVEDVDALLYVINLGAIPLHVWSSRLGSLERPDWCVLDLDPKDAPFIWVVEVAQAVKSLADRAGLPTYVKSTGSSGLHVEIPLAGQLTHEQSRTLAELLARLVVRELPEVATVVRRVSHREGRVYVDYGQNGHGRLTVCPFSVRPLPGAPVAMPLTWREVRPSLDIHRYTIANAARRMRALGRDPLAGVLGEVADLVGCLDALGGALAGDGRGG